MRTSARVAAPLAALLLAGCAGPGATASDAPVSSAGRAGSSSATVVAPVAPVAASDAPDPAPAPVPTSADPVSLHGVRPCRASDVRVTTRRDGATGLAIVDVLLVARAGVTCRLDDRPRAEVVARGGTVPTVRQKVFGPPWKGPVLVSAGHAGVVELTWRWTRWCAPPVRDLRLELRLPGGGVVTAPVFGESSCDGGPVPGAPPEQPVGVSRYFPDR